ncbi:[FeFe] hydrogenase H-cluster maturation GTPase HydF [[Clostridium] polysaccharolyticum]|uniref:[FeFe] hydrogenase H-cluster maturation GTPase HydF n=1 Tax=[Clostridium] polysaccharolyticum TaxID=29364 RepID=A0A1H9Y1E1_9FIRM|nr:[FeFe] hydrogenase H-cluster maturation GTPase HydF [[Clostridium] polysaccharolyticum]SES62057.1 [FeFe] hydrogenase H-cluster maturation GTPase HydF [[Clostridium] polysaccharolyticum]
MGLNDTPRGERLHIAVFGRRNAGKSSLINSITGQELSIVSNVRGTTTDPVYKAMELLPLGPVMMIDTPGLDDEGELGQLRVEKTRMVLNKADVALVVVDGASVCGSETDFSVELELLNQIRERELPYKIVLNKKEVCLDVDKAIALIKKKFGTEEVFCASAKNAEGIHELKEALSAIIQTEDSERRIVGDLLEPNDFVVLVVPIDSAAPKGRLILPQQQTIRDILEAGANAIVVRDLELAETLKSLGKRPKLVITDSQAFESVSKDTPEDMLLTSFSILFSRYKGNLTQQVQGAKAVETLKDGDCVLMAEGCTHHRQCDDIGTVKIPRWLKQHTGKEIVFETSSGTGFPKDLSKYKLIVHCGGCTLNKKEMQYRLGQAKEQGVPVVNYGILIAYMKGILGRSLEPFGEAFYKKE